MAGHSFRMRLTVVFLCCLEQDAEPCSRGVAMPLRRRGAAALREGGCGRLGVESRKGRWGQKAGWMAPAGVYLVPLEPLVPI